MTPSTFDSAFVIPGTVKDHYIMAKPGCHPAIRFTAKVMSTPAVLSLSRMGNSLRAAQALADAGETDFDAEEICAEEVLAKAKVLAKYIDRWDLIDATGAFGEAGKIAPITVVSVAALGYFAFLRIEEVTAGWAAGDPDPRNAGDKPATREDDLKN